MTAMIIVHKPIICNLVAGITYMVQLYLFSYLLRMCSRSS